MKRLLLALVIGLMSCGVMAESPNDVVREAVDALEAGLEGRKDQLAEDEVALYELIDQILLPRFDRKYAAQLVLGKHWRSASDTERDEFIDAFYGSLRRKYGEGVLQFDQSSLEILPFDGDDTKPRTTVRTRVQLDDGTQVPVDYAVVKRDAGWMMFDVKIEGISYVLTARNDLNSEIRAKGLPAVIDRLNSGQTTAAASE